MHTYWNENAGVFSGTVLAEPEFSHENHGEDYFRFPLRILRLSGAEDVVPVVVSRSQLEFRPIHPQNRLTVEGEIRSFNNRSGVGSRLVERSPLVAALYEGHPLAGRKTPRRRDLRRETILYMTPSGSGDSIADAHFMQLYEKAGYQPRILLKSNDVESILMMVASEQGVSILPHYTVAKLTGAGHLVFVPLEGEDEVEEIFMLWKTGRENAALRLFTEEFSF